MSDLDSTANIVCGIKKGSTWGTEVQITGATATRLTPSSLNLSSAFADFLPRDIGLGVKRVSQARLQHDCSFSISFDLTYNQGWLALLAGFFGTESSPTETTVGQADYSDNIDLADSTKGNFWTLAWSIETDRVLVIPSFKPVSFTWTHAVNSAGTITFQCMADRALQSSTTAVSDLSGLTSYTYETATWGGANHYFRQNTQASGALSSTNNITGLNYELAMQRPHAPIFGFRGASSQYTTEPKQNGDIDGTLKLKVINADDATLDAIGLWTAKTKLKAEFFTDGSQIAAGVNSSLKVSMPYVEPIGAVPTGHDWANNNSFMQPEITYRLLKASAAPTGMTGITDLARVVPVFSTRTTRWSA